MYPKGLILTALIFIGGLIASVPSLASDDYYSSVGANKTTRSNETSHDASVLRRIAFALAAGGNALSSFDGRRLEDEAGKDRLDPPVPGMDCNLDVIAEYVACYGSPTGNKDDAAHRFVRLIDELHDVLPSDDWMGAEAESRIEAIRSYTFEDRHSHAQIDIDLIAQKALEGE